ncbi:non-hydrolyzing UDP-N-acetylglucosamine 2-epimerase [Conexibacter arvalis]|uniref:UDP-N-acetylglucosamine 2-epimerase (Non-hydrolyzing)/UDP-GlcNAc3NAcA epimerase n=1 Tax=Conexibacter arvalis TaxID=912552 RepID=A0A840I949_9ACTN|nr:UDP-N-acetylglucosamine 2-epimerase (non-hydrolyzing) [Conexibacter arvalis]MBB4661082.1 UDP-N-acetylglucosamine 2-epimerase (non-hydrolyzing)/UDP-GlcNAc3NAcA epimerase [Conexibacter arvalis]
MRVLTVIGNRPQFIKASAVSSRLRARAEEITVHTGQHYDRELSQVFFDELKLPPPEHLLGIGGGTNTAQTARMLAALEPLLSDLRPDAVLVYGDTNSTLAGALAAVQAGIPVAHVEAGMRSFDRAMPEEVNRVVCDHLSSLLLVPSKTAVDNLARESVPGRVEEVGDVMVDVALLLQPACRARTEALEPYGVEPGGYLLATAHRAGNVDDPARLAQLVDLLLSLPDPVVLPLHPRTRARLEAADLLRAVEAAPDLHLAPPLGYLDFTALLCNARAVVTDSGGVQKEAYLAGVPCVTMRPSTEWVETVETGWNALVDLDGERARAALARPLPRERPQLYGDGQAGQRVADAVATLAG